MMISVAGTGLMNVHIPIPSNYLFPERFEGKNLVPLSEVCQYDFDYIVISHPYYEQFRSKLRRLGIKNKKILSLAGNEKACLDKLGEEKFFLSRKKQFVEGKPSRHYELLELRGKSTDNIAPPIPLEQQFPVVEKLLHSCRLALKDIQDMPSAYRPGSNWWSFLKATRGDFWDLIERNDVAKMTELLNNCLRNHLTEGMYGGETAFRDFKNTPVREITNRMKDCYKSWAYTINEEPNIQKLATPPIGNPFGLNVEGVIINANNFYNHYRAVFASRLVRDTQRPVIAEIGGGVGLFGFYVQKQTPGLVYLDFDLPENLLVASYYLSMAFPEKRILGYQGAGMKIDAQLLNSYDIILMPNFMLPNVSDQSVELFTNTISLSEMDYETIAEYMTQIQRTCRKYFYSENLADFNFSYKSYPAAFFPIPDGFQEIMTAPSRWPHFAMWSHDHMYVETLYAKKTDRIVPQ